MDRVPSKILGGVAAKTGENPVRRRGQGSTATFIRRGSTERPLGIATRVAEVKEKTLKPSSPGVVDTLEECPVSRAVPQAVVTELAAREECDALVEDIAMHESLGSGLASTRAPRRGSLPPTAREADKKDTGFRFSRVTASYRVYLNEADAKKVFAYIKHLQETSPLWNAATANCTLFLGRIASFMGLNAPFHLLLPEEYVNQLRELNGGRKTVQLEPDRG